MERVLNKTELRLPEIAALFKVKQQKIPPIGCEPEFKTFKEPKNRFQGTRSARLWSLAGRYGNSIPTQFLTP
jgi:hypothetical protein